MYEHTFTTRYRSYEKAVRAPGDLCKGVEAATAALGGVILESGDGTTGLLLTDLYE